MRRALDFLGITRSKGSPRAKLLITLVGGFGLSLIIFGVAVIAGNVDAGHPAAIWIGGALIAVGLACWIVEGILSSHTTSDGPSR